MSLQHVSAHWVPPSGSVISQDLKPTPMVYIVVILRTMCVAVVYKVKLKCGYSAVHKMSYIHKAVL